MIEEGKSGESLGCRVFGDCDELIMEVMSCLVPSEELVKWQSEHQSRLDDYNKQRSTFTD